MSSLMKPREEEAGPESEHEAVPEAENLSIVQEFVLFLRENKKWWLIPIIVMVLIIGALLIFGAGPLSPFLYTLI
jgi:hypothetical protein